MLLQMTCFILSSVRVMFLCGGVYAISPLDSVAVNIGVHVIL